MPPMNGKSGTITPEEFETLSGFVGDYSAILLAKKVAKICTKFSGPFKHEYANSAIAAAWLTIASRINGVIGNASGTVSTDAFEFLGSLVNTYGPEVVVQKLAKIGLKNGEMPTAVNGLKNLFPKPVASSSSARRAA